MAASVYSRTLQKAAELIGGRARLCRHLHVPAAELQKFLNLVFSVIYPVTAFQGLFAR